jgi:hypothetical protein
MHTSSCDCGKINQMAISVTIGGSKIECLELISPTDPAFDAAARSLFRGNCDELLKLKPFLTIVSNRCDRTLVAYALAWNVAQHETHITVRPAQIP